MIMRKALVVGINEYKSTPLSGCINDAEAITQRLSRNGDNSVNFSVKNQFNVPTKGILRGYIEDCFSGDADIALFYFSGHGYIDSIGGYIVTPDFSSHDMGVSMQDILTIANQSKCKNRVVILDCCHAGFMGAISTAEQQTAIIGDGVTVLTACKTEQTAKETCGYGIFTALLLESLDGGAADVTGHITLGGIYAYIDKALGPWEQRPVFKTNVTRFSPLRIVKPQIDIEILRRIPEYFPTPSDEFNLDPSFEPTNALDVKHIVTEPYTNPTIAKVFSDLQKLEGVGLLVPCGEEHMYFAAMNSKSCRLTSIGQHFWNLMKNNII
jgi:uncharacterized caspase-like protein